jgi:alkanesulfonate monooxygenase SsuD/methylene tetrahydromethanopterin reductase-like flavin-dependent oxidoreductase (luciferase family)
MRYGFYLPTRGPTATRAGVLALAREGERLGLHSAMIADHIVFPLESESAYPYTVDRKHPGGGDALETFSILGVVAGATERLRLVTSVLVLPYRNPVLTAKMVASLDVLSGGRVTLGVGVGWLKEEFEALDSPEFDRRGAVTDEWITIFKQLWTQSPASFTASSTAMPTFAPNPSHCRSRIRPSGSAVTPRPRCVAPRDTATAGIRSAPSPPRRCRRKRCGRISTR